MKDAYVRTTTAMGTVVTAHVVGQSRRTTSREESARRALRWFERIERACSRFDPDSEVNRATARVGEAVRVSDELYQTVAFALAAAQVTNGAFDPTVGQALELAGFNREYRTGREIHTSIAESQVSYRNVFVDADEKTLTVDAPLVLDLGGVAKGLAVDLAARELLGDGFENFVIDAGGDLYLAGHNANDEPWSVGIRHPRDPSAIIETICVSDVGVCTSGDYEQHTNAGGITHHIIDPRTRRSTDYAASVTVMADSTMPADALSTAAFVMEPRNAIELFRQEQVQGIIFTPTLERFATDQ